MRSDGIPSGLKNLGNTCYVNSFLQIWFHNSIFRQVSFRICLRFLVCFICSLLQKVLLYLSFSMSMIGTYLISILFVMSIVCCSRKVCCLCLSCSMCMCPRLPLLGNLYDLEFYGHVFIWKIAIILQIYVPISCFEFMVLFIS